MPFMPGDKLGPYEIGEPPGEGGMGEADRVDLPAIRNDAGAEGNIRLRKTR
jgi:hypothetical protein